MSEAEQYDRDVRVSSLLNEIGCALSVIVCLILAFVLGAIYGGFLFGA